MPWGVLFIAFVFLSFTSALFSIPFDVLGSWHYATQAGYLKSQEGNEY